MSASDRGRLVVLSGPSGAGKTTVCERLVERPEFARITTCTTRTPRPDEHDGEDYHFLAREEFETRRARGDFLEWAEVHDELYGTLRQEVDGAVRAGKTALLAIDVQGAEQVRRQVREETRKQSGASQWELATIFLTAPSREELRRRLADRGAETPEQVDSRLNAAEREMARSGEFDTIITNTELDRTIEEVLDYLSDPADSSVQD